MFSLFKKTQDSGEPLKLTERQLDEIQEYLSSRGKNRDLALLIFARYSKLPADEVRKYVWNAPDGPREDGIVGLDEKAKKSSGFDQMSEEHSALFRRWIDEARIQHNEYIFRHRRSNKPLHRGYCDRLVKRWVAKIDLDPLMFNFSSLFK